mgnify:CR=1 FL=1
MLHRLLDLLIPDRKARRIAYLKARIEKYLSHPQGEPQ